MELIARSSANYVRRPSGNANGLERARKTLLDKSDWVGLATVRPLKSNPRARDDMEGLGRRRKTAQFKRGTPMSQKDSVQRVLRSTRRALRVPSLRTEEISLRIGSNLHQTQTTPSVVVRKEPIHTAERAIHELVPSDKVWDRKETGKTGKETRGTSSDSTHSYACEPRTGRTADLNSADRNNLITLDEVVALGLTSWDKVRGHAGLGVNTSVSIANSSRKEKNSLGTQVDVHWKHASHQEAEALAIPGSSREQLHMQASRPDLPDIIRRVIAVGLIKDGSGQNSYPAPFPEPVLHACHPPGPSHSLVDESIPVAPEATYKYDVAIDAELPSHPQFTLDDQVKLEQTVEELEQESQQVGESSSAADNSGQSDTVDSPWCSRSISTSAVGVVNDRALSKSPYIFSSSEDESHARHNPATRTAGNLTNCVTTEQKLQAEEIATHMTTEAGFMLASQGVEAQLDAVPIIDKELYSRHGISSTWVGPERPESALRFFGSPTSIPTTVNTSIFIPLPADRDHSETDFLSEFSPMEGRLDERLVDISLYNNASKTDPGIGTSPTGGLLGSGSTASRNLPMSLIPAKRKAPDQSRERTSSGWLKSIDCSGPKSLPPPHSQLSAWSFGDSVDPGRDSTGTTIKRLSAAACPDRATAFRDMVNGLGKTQTLVQDGLKKNEQGLNIVAHREGASTSIFGRSDKLTAGSSPSRSCRATRSTIRDYAQPASFQSWSDVSTPATPRFAGLEAADTPLPAPMQSMTLLRQCERNNHIASNGDPQPRDFVHGTTQFSTQVPLWSEGQ
ncbi:uncharacterized protein PV07_09146 [Cladophialophora immunda]|uniref:Uncharacterized protein n=1 Tax=Cladophialophora immunda TaxID=569365 RepID=A0A0D2ALT3_9EURO|nr:uncharacterized protein PV07_09146 [Cladophialophora immunda]KIW26017.1 hypothetical protein PV07_09146 [Cladophialophora immunda]